MRSRFAFLLVFVAACHGHDKDHQSYTSLELYPGDLAISKGSEFPLRAVAVEDDGDRADVIAHFRSSDPDIVSVTGTTAKAVTSGNAMLHADYAGLTTDATITVTAGSSIIVDVVDARTGDPVPRADVVWDGHTHAADSHGSLHFNVNAGEDTTLTVTADGYVPATFYDIKAREVVLPLRQIPEDQPEVELQGTVDLSEVKSADVGSKIVGLSVAALQDPMLLDVADLFADPREITISGYDVQAPSNIYVDHSVDSWSLDVAPAQTTGVWTIAGPLPVVSMATSFDDTQSALEAFFSHTNDFSYAWQPNVQVPNQDQSITVALQPWATFDDKIDVDVAELPTSFNGNETALVLILATQADTDGEAVIGMATGTGTVTVPRVPDQHFSWSGDPRALAITQRGGLGTQGARMLAVGTVRDGQTTLPDWQDSPRAEAFSAESHEFSIVTDDRATVAYVTVTSPRGDARDLYFPGGRFDGQFPEDGITMGYGQTTWTIHAIETSTETYDGLLAAGEISPSYAEALARTTAILAAEFTADPSNAN